jgi:sigma-B regulation protein RsbU (phosphoserine phosphatase)
MYVSDPQLTASQVLRAFHHDEAYIFLGAAFTAIGLVAAAFAFLSRKFDAMLFWLALFAILYGGRLWLHLTLLSMMVPPSLFFDSLKASINYLAPIPAFLYFEAAGFLGRSGRKIVIALTVLFLCLFVATFFVSPQNFVRWINRFEWINRVVIITSLVALNQSIRRKQVDRDFVIIRRGIAIFVAFALFENISGAFRSYPNTEAFGFAFFLGTLGYVAAKRSIHRDQQFSQIQKELEIARNIQTSILPSSFPHSDHFTVAARYVPMTSVAGDFYDFLLTDRQQAGLLIADVSGHGVPAAMIASMVKLAATSQRANAADPATFLSGMNTVLYGNTQEQFVTAAYVYLDAASSTLRYSAAAHPPMLLLRAEEIIPIEENGLMLAAFSFATYETAVHAIQPGDRLLLYTDGLLEAANKSGEEFGSERLSTLLRETEHQNAEQAADHIVYSLQLWAKSQNDDLTLLICDYASAPAS